MPFEIGTAVHVASLGKGVVREVRNGRYLVEVKGRAMLVEETQLTATEHRGGHKRSSPEPVSRGELTRTSAAAALDLHGMRVEDAIAAVDEFLSEAILAGHAEVQVIHGRSGGKLRNAVHRRLKQVTAVRAFRLDPRNPGVTIVTF